MNIYTKLTLLCVALVVFTSSVIYFIVNQEIGKTFRNELLANVTQQSEQTVSNIEQFVSSRIADLRLAATNPIFRQNNVPTEELTKRLQELENLNDLYYSFSFFDNNRLRLADSKRLSIGKVHSYVGYWTSINPEVNTVVDVSHSESVDRNVMHFATVVKNLENENPRGVLVGRILTDELYKFMGKINLGDNDERVLNVNLLDKDGIILYSQDPNKKVLEDKFENFETIKSSNPGSDKRVSFLETDDTLYFIGKQITNLSSSQNEWILVVSISKADAYLPLYVIQKQLLIASSIVLAIAIILALYFANVLVKPIIQLSHLAEKIGQGDHSVEIPINSKDEVGILAAQLSNASQTLIKRIDEQKKFNDRLELQKNEMSEQKHQLEHANKQIKDSIIYAQKIQRSILPDQNVISRLVKDSFVFYEPKDVVSGDFYWFERVRQGRNEYLIIACADCTGHGVPGAIMSIMGSNQLTNIVYYQNYIDPVKILTRLDKVIKFELKRDETENKDGMEMGICVINLDDLKMEFAGVGIPLYMVKKGTKELLMYKSPKLMIGGIEGDEKEVSGQLIREEIQLHEGDKIYLSSDGFQDQFGGDKDKKFMSKNFKSLIEEICELPMKDQAAKIEHTFHDWKQDIPQTDDVVVIGIEI